MSSALDFLKSATIELTLLSNTLRRGDDFSTVITPDTFFKECMKPLNSLGSALLKLDKERSYERMNLLNKSGTDVENLFDIVFKLVAGAPDKSFPKNDVHLRMAQIRAAYEYAASSEIILESVLRWIPLLTTISSCLVDLSYDYYKGSRPVSSEANKALPKSILMVKHAEEMRILKTNYGHSLKLLSSTISEMEDKLKNLEQFKGRLIRDLGRYPKMFNELTTSNTLLSNERDMLELKYAQLFAFVTNENRISSAGLDPSFKPKAPLATGDYAEFAKTCERDEELANLTPLAFQNITMKNKSTSSKYKEVPKKPAPINMPLKNTPSNKIPEKNGTQEKNETNPKVNSKSKSTSATSTATATATATATTTTTAAKNSGLKENPNTKTMRQEESSQSSNSSIPKSESPSSASRPLSQQQSRARSPEDEIDEHDATRTASPQPASKSAVVLPWHGVEESKLVGKNDLGRPKNYTHQRTLDHADPEAPKTSSFLSSTREGPGSAAVAAAGADAAGDAQLAHDVREVLAQHSEHMARPRKRLVERMIPELGDYSTKALHKAEAKAGTQFMSMAVPASMTQPGTPLDTIKAAEDLATDSVDPYYTHAWNTQDVSCQEQMRRGFQVPEDARYPAETFAHMLGFDPTGLGFAEILDEFGTTRGLCDEADCPIHEPHKTHVGKSSGVPNPIHGVWTDMVKQANELSRIERRDDNVPMGSVPEVRTRRVPIAAQRLNGKPVFGPEVPASMLE
ncbi:uncharacterized protein SAPINGB_P003520 [Magnusiomyces paraingens]|uniref:Uncharacterized protein n=1 Tax=Magnusiomyces paraingens TaxID=2606893 RepID=A0A5E8BPR3_9ASCO|nr:uncharacterized protein SAPINGB_P003520 [Saprochaete ingens]VVT53333.1 unnamed protein product [Saprochaete ingens]